MALAYSPPFLPLFLLSLILTTPTFTLSQISLPPSLSPSSLPADDSLSPSPFSSISLPPFSSPPAPTPFTEPILSSPSPSPLSSSPVPAPAHEELKAGAIDEAEEDQQRDEREKKEMNGGKKAGVAVGLFAAAAVVGLGVFVCKRRRDNIRRSRYAGYDSRTVELV
ncbi:hypothetical protein LUZ60_002252 [Juncus effusus]|nr:hypothetical protein LUZ60_002252 [Juncus effusus]